MRPALHATWVVSGSCVMTIKITLGSRCALTLIAVAGLLAACSGRDSQARAEDGSVDAGATLAPARTATSGAPGVHVTRTDARSVADAGAFLLTDEKLAAFMIAAESLAALQRRDPDVRAYLDVRISDAGVSGADAGRKWLEANEKAGRAIGASGLTVSDYYVASIAVANAERFLNHPKSVRATRALARNARLLQSHGRDLARLHALRAP